MEDAARAPHLRGALLGDDLNDALTGAGVRVDVFAVAAGAERKCDCGKSFLLMHTAASSGWLVPYIATPRLVDANTPCTLSLRVRLYLRAARETLPLLLGRDDPTPPPPSLRAAHSLSTPLTGNATPDSSRRRSCLRGTRTGAVPYYVYHPQFSHQREEPLRCRCRRRRLYYLPSTMMTGARKTNSVLPPGGVRAMVEGDFDIGCIPEIGWEMGHRRRLCRLRRNRFGAGMRRERRRCSEIFDLNTITSLHERLVTVVLSKAMLKTYGGTAADNIFPVQVRALCNGGISAYVVFSSSNNTDPNTQYHDLRFFTDDSRPHWYFESMLQMRWTARVGFAGLTPKEIRTKANNGSSIGIYNGLVYDLTSYVQSPRGVAAPAGTVAPQVDTDFMSDQVVDVFKLDVPSPAPRRRSAPAGLLNGRSECSMSIGVLPVLQDVKHLAGIVSAHQTPGGDRRREPDEELTAEALTLIAGLDTTSNSIGAIVCNLAVNPDVQVRLQVELDEQLGTKDEEVATGKQAKRLSCPDTCIVEVLRNTRHRHGAFKASPRLIPAYSVLLANGHCVGKISSMPSRRPLCVPQPPGSLHDAYVGPPLTPAQHGHSLRAQSSRDKCGPGLYACPTSSARSSPMLMLRRPFAYLTFEGTSLLVMSKEDYCAMRICETGLTSKTANIRTNLGRKFDMFREMASAKKRGAGPRAMFANRQRDMGETIRSWGRGGRDRDGGRGGRGRGARRETMLQSGKEELVVEPDAGLDVGVFLALAAYHTFVAAVPPHIHAAHLTTCQITPSSSDCARP
ncbi:hypothetical protein B0H11DRAFT_2237653 [Mycena galericulata]|nr:hypothetical protein B0H11DRAFT_2237653 [Mycena galericulata]